MRNTRVIILIFVGDRFERRTRSEVNNTTHRSQPALVLQVYILMETNYSSWTVATGGVILKSVYKHYMKINIYDSRDTHRRFI